jgi:hypothetical protein
MDYFHPAHSLVGEPVGVFFFTDIGYEVHDDRLAWNDNFDINYTAPPRRSPYRLEDGSKADIAYKPLHRSRELLRFQDGSEFPAMVCLVSNPNALCVHIKIDDAIFEKKILGSALKIDVVSYLNGMMSGPGPRDLNGLGAEFSFGEPRENRDAWANGIQWEATEFGLTVATGFCLIPLSKRFLNNRGGEGRTVEFCKVARLPHVLPEGHYAEISTSGFSADLANCSQPCTLSELDVKDLKERVEQIGNDLKRAKKNGELEGVEALF